MDIAGFKASLKHAAPPTGIDAALGALWWAAKGDLDKAHELAQAQEDDRGSWAHAYLHRVEGDESNAGYWYRRARKPHASGPLPQEWDAIVAAMLSGGPAAG
jgi:hypothetical protein